MIKSLGSVTVLLTLVGAVSSADLYRLDSKGENKTANVKVGDWVQITFRYPVVPDGIINSFEIATTGDSMKFLKELHTQVQSPDGKPLVGVGERVLFFEAVQAGKASIGIIPITGKNNRGPKVEFKVAVAK